MKTITKAQYLYLKSKKNAYLSKNETVTIEDEEYEDLIQYSNKQITPIDDGNDEPQEIYTITFKDGDEIVRTITGPMGTYVSVPYVEKEGYKFIGWSLDGEKITMPADGIYDSDITYIAVWEKIEQEEPEPQQEETYNYSGCDFGIGQWGYNIISLEDRTVSIGKYCGNRDTLIKAIIPETVEYNNILFSVTSIGVGAFGNCRNLTSIDISDNIISIGDSAFGYCNSLKSIIIPDNVTSIGRSAFSNCRNLTSITIGNGIICIEPKVLDYCSNLRSITIYSEYNFSININDLNINHQITIYVLSELVNIYKSYYEKDIFVGKVNILPIE